MINYYTKFIGLTGDIQKEDLMIEEDKTTMQKEIDKLKWALQKQIVDSDKRYEKMQDEMPMWLEKFSKGMREKLGEIKLKA